MDKDFRADDPILDTQEMNRALARIAERSRRAVADFLDRQSRDSSLADVFDPLHVGDAFLQMTAQILAGPAQIVEAQMSLWSSYMQLWQHTARTMLGESETPAEDGGQWNRDEVFDFVKQSYLLTARWIQALLRSNGQLGDSDVQLVDSQTRRFAEAMSSAGFFAANPDVLDAVIASQGDNLIRGIDHILAELDRGKGRLTGVEAPDRPASPSRVVFRNRSMELLQFSASTAKVHEVPLLVVPPWNARPYLLDLEPSASLIKWAVDQGHTVFALNWTPPEGELAQRDFGDTLKEGPMAALEAIETLTGQRRVNGLGFGLGGTLLAAALGVLAARGEDRFASATYLGALTDFAEMGELDAEPAALSAAVDLLRANDLIWSFIVDCALDDTTPLPFELLRWNADGLNPETATQDFFLRAIHQRNLLAEPGGIMLNGSPVDLGGITAPAYVLAGREDPIAPWKAVYAATRLFSGPVRFVLAPSGHAGAIVAPPGRGRFHWTNTRRAKDPEAWLRNATRQPGSWWQDWTRWLAPLSGAMVKART